MPTRLFLRPIFAASLLALGAGTVSAGAAEIDARYRVSYGALPVARLDADVAVNGDAYTIDARFSSSGVAQLMGRTEGRASAGGTLGGGGLAPDRFAVSYETGDKNRARDVSLRGGTVREATETPPRKPRDNFRPASGGDLENVIDPASAFLRVAPDGEPCRGAMRVFDGRTRIDLALRPLDRVPFRADGYRGDVRRCAISPSLVSGYREGRRTAERVSETKGTRVAFAPVPGTDLMMLVELEVPTSIGRFRLKLREIAFKR